MITKTLDVLHRIAPKFSFAKSGRRNRNRHISYAQLERRQVLTTILLPEMTTDLAVFEESTQNATVHVNDSSELVIRVTGEENYIEINLDWGQIRVNPTKQEPVLGIDVDRYEKILVVGDGDDNLVVIGDGLRAQMHPQRTWIKAENYFRQEGQELTIHGIGLEDVEIRDFIVPFSGSLSNSNVVRMFGSDGSDHLTMTDAISATVVGEGYQYRASGLGKLFAFANGGENFASVIGTREIPGDSTLIESNWHCAALNTTRTCFPYQISDGVDLFYAADNFANLQNSLIDARFVDFGTTRVDLLSGVDQVHIQDTEAESSWYRVDGESLVGANRRFINSERITIDGTGIANDQLVTPDLSAGEFESDENDRSYSFRRDTTVLLPEGEAKYEGLNQVIPDEFYWAWNSFETIL